MDLLKFQDLDNDKKKEKLLKCCGSLKWVDRMLEGDSFQNEKKLINEAANIWYTSCEKEDWLEAFNHHPKIGDLESLKKKFASTSHLTSQEQAGVKEASEEVIVQLAEANEAYEAIFGYIFIICATGKTASEMLRLLKDRLENSEEEEIKVAMGEQHKITVLRLKKLLREASWSDVKGSHVTTHVLDTTLGKPGQDMTIQLQENTNGNWQTLAQGVTNSDGRIADLLPSGKFLEPGNYQMLFQTGRYFKDKNLKGFYPKVGIQFTVFDDTHYHVPLLINPFGYSTYRGS